MNLHNPFTNSDSVADIANIVLCESVKFPDSLSSDDNDALKSILKAFPAGSKFDTLSNKLVWEKRGGYAGEKSLATTREKLEKIGFKWSKGDISGLPDGSTAAFTTTLVNKKLGYAVGFIQFYGQSASRNVFKLTAFKIDN